MFRVLLFLLFLTLVSGKVSRHLLATTTKKVTTKAPTTTVAATTAGPFVPYYLRNMNVTDMQTGYIGCFIDDETRDMGNWPSLEGFTIASARAFCWGYKYFSLQYNGYAFCSNSFGTTPMYGQVANAECDVYQNQYGGDWRNAVFLTEFYVNGFIPYSSRNMSVQDTTTGFIGCFVDDENRDMGFYPGTSGYADIYSARITCAGFRYFSIQDGGQLICSNFFGTTATYAMVDNSECGSSPSALFGAPWRNAVYLTSFDPVATAAPFVPYSSRNMSVSDAVTGYIGCFIDGLTKDMGSTPGGQGYTIESARSNCVNYKYFGLSNGQAFCSDVFGTLPVYSQVDDNECGVTRTGDNWRNAVYITNFVSNVTTVPFIPYSSRNLPIQDSSTGFIGCFVDDVNRDMGSYPNQGGHTVETARSFCSGYKYFSLQYNGVAFCSNVFGTSEYYPQVADYECNSYNYQTGSDWRNAVFLTDYTPPLVPSSCVIAFNGRNYDFNQMSSTTINFSAGPISYSLKICNSITQVASNSQLYQIASSWGNAVLYRNKNAFTMRIKTGDICPYAPRVNIPRTAIVTFTCAQTTSVTLVVENPLCTYNFQVSTPLVC